MIVVKDEKNRKLAEWLSPNGEHADGDDWDVYPDFYTDEAANALLLEKMPDPMLWVESEGPRIWGCEPESADASREYYPQAFAADRKTAIAEAALKLLEAK